MTFTISNYCIAVLELIEDGLRKLIAGSDQLQEKLELHKMAVVNVQHAKAAAKLDKLAVALSEIDQARQRSIAIANNAANEAKARVAQLQATAEADRDAKFDTLVVAEDDYTSKAIGRGWIA